MRASWALLLAGGLAHYLAGAANSSPSGTTTPMSREFAPIGGSGPRATRQTVDIHDWAERRLLSRLSRE
jgi:hypothetical protein